MGPPLRIERKLVSWGDNFICRFMLAVCAFVGEVSLYDRADRARIEFPEEFGVIMKRASVTMER